jgi:hypothetical protein
MGEEYLIEGSHQGCGRRRLSGRFGSNDSGTPITTAIHSHLSCERALAGEVGVGGAVHVGLSLCSEMLRRGHGLAAVPVLNKGTISAHYLVCAAPRSSLCIRST